MEQEGVALFVEQARQVRDWPVPEVIEYPLKRLKVLGHLPVHAYEVPFHSELIRNSFENWQQTPVLLDDLTSSVQGDRPAQLSDR